MTKAIWGLHDICPSLMQFHISGITRAGLSAISQTGGWGNPKRQLQGMAYLLLVPSQEAEEEKRFGLAGVWVHPNQILLPSLEEASEETYFTYQHKGGLVLLPLCESMKMHSTSPFPMPDTSVS